MGKPTLAETIREITRKHLEEGNGLLLGESITAVGWVNHTVPDCKNIIDLPMTDVAGAGIAVGAALVGRRPFFVVRFQDFMILNGSPLIFYAAKIKELHGSSAPVFIRAIGIDRVGPVHSGVLHGLFMHFPGFRVCSPMTPGEYKKIWDDFMSHDDPMYVSEHRSSYQQTEELPDQTRSDAKITLYGISCARFEVVKAAKILEEMGIPCNTVHLYWLKPLQLDQRILDPLRKSGRALVVDPGHEIAGASQSIAQELHEKTELPVRALGLMDQTKCLCEPLTNATPSAEKIVQEVTSWISDGKNNGKTQ